MNKYTQWLSNQRGFAHAPERVIRPRMMRRFPELTREKAVALILVWKRGREKGEL